MAASSRTQEQSVLPAALMAGTLVSKGRHDPVGGIHLVARAYVGPKPDSDVTELVDVASGFTGPDGVFVLTLEPAIPDWFRDAVEADPSMVLILAVIGSSEYPVEANSRNGSTVYEFPSRHVPVNWADIVSAARARGLYRVNDIAVAVGDPAIVADVNVRLSAVAELEAAFLDPTGKVGAAEADEEFPSWRALVSGDHDDFGMRINELPAVAELRRRLASFDNLSQVDWPIDLEKLARGDVSGAVNAHAASFLHGPGRAIGPMGRPNPLIGYRDYLLAVWAKIAAQKPNFSSQQPLTAAQALAQLTNRFHQDFTTKDTAVVPANELLIPIVVKVLTTKKPMGAGMVSAPPRPVGQSARDYLDVLIGASGVGTTELGLRYRLDLWQTDAAKTSAVQQNIDTLQGFFRDSFQSEADPANTQPDVRRDQIIPDWQEGKAPFFLQFEEWKMQTAVFYPENHLSMTRTLRPEELAGYGHDFDASVDAALKVWRAKAGAVFVDITKVVSWITSGEYQLALNLLDDTRRGAVNLITERIAAGYKVEPPLRARKRLTITDKPSLLTFERYLGFPSSSGNPTPYEFPPGNGTENRLTAALVLHAGYFYWAWRSDILLATGRFTEAATSLEALVTAAVGTASQDSAPGYFNYWNRGDAYLYTAGPLPYTFDRSWDVQNVNPRFTDTPYESAGLSGPDPWLPEDGIVPLLHRVDILFLKLRLGNILLEWADMLFRADDASSTARARELYKSVLWLHGETVPISPWWPENHRESGGLPGDGLYWSLDVNPAVVSQTTRARKGFTLIEGGLNYFGLTADMVPVQRYRTLKDQADEFAALAVAAERDFVAAIANLEQLSVEEMRNSNLLTKARAQQGIAAEQKEVANYNVAVAKQQVTEVQKQIDAKKAEIADHNGIFSQYSDFFSGVVKTFTSAPGGLTSGIGSAIKSEAGFGASESAGLLGLGAGASVLAGYGLFAYAGYSSLSGMASTYKSREGELKRLEEVTMPLATGNVAARQHEVSIASLGATIADADVQLAQRLMAFNTQRLLNAEFWTSIVAVLRRVLRRYLDLGGWAAWLAERALAFEQDRPLRVVRMDYLVRSLQNVTGGELLQGDLAELEAARISGQRVLAPFTYSLSLAEEFPLAFGALKTRGSCTFSTTEAALQKFFPGTFGHRVRTLDVDVRLLSAGGRVRGTLVNHGVSLASTDESLRLRPLLRFPDAVAVSESDDSGRPDPRLQEVLGPFEGSGLDTTWTLRLDRGASAGWWDAIADVIIEIQGLARFSDSVRVATPPAAPTQRFVMLAAGAFAPTALKNLKSGGTGAVDFDLRTVPLAVGEKNRKVTNLAVLLPGAKGAQVNARLNPGNIAFKITDGVAMSNGAPLRLPGSTTPDQQLNPAIGATVEQRWTVKIEASPNADLTGLVDVILGIDYTADPA